MRQFWLIIGLQWKTSAMKISFVSHIENNSLLHSNCWLKPVINFTNILTSSIHAQRFQKCKNTLTTLLSFCTFGYLRVQKLYVNMLVKSTPEVDFTNILTSNFLSLFFPPKKQSQTIRLAAVRTEHFHAKISS